MNGRGRQRELAVVRWLIESGSVAYRLPQGPADVIALGGELPRPLLVQVKSTAGGPYEHFGPADRRELIDEAEHAQADAVLCWWPAGQREPLWIDAGGWPPLRVVA